MSSGRLAFQSSAHFLLTQTALNETGLKREKGQTGERKTLAISHLLVQELTHTRSRRGTCAITEVESHPSVLFYSNYCIMSGQISPQAELQIPCMLFEFW